MTAPVHGHQNRLKIALRPYTRRGNRHPSTTRGRLMPRDIDGLLDDIDQLVDEQLAGGPVDDYNVDRYDRCPHCHRQWHGIAITERIETMRWLSTFDETYRTRLQAEAATARQQLADRMRSRIQEMGTA